MQCLLRAYGQAVWLWIQPFKWRLGYLLIFTFFIWYKDFHIQIRLDTGELTTTSNFIEKGSTPKNTFEVKGKENFQHLTSNEELLPKASNQQRTYVRRFAHVARAEMEQYGIPASITLAQGLLESQAGKSPLAKEANNHFGIKCFSKKCKKGHCRNFSDDHHKDFFRKYPSAWESYRAHSLFLQKNRYKHLLDLEKDDYKSWAYGLKKAGYATDPKYPQKLIRLIEGLDLAKYDI